MFLTENKSIWVGELESKYIPYSISQYQTFLLVYTYTTWSKKPMLHCFDQGTGNMLWSGLVKHLIANGFPLHRPALGGCRLLMSWLRETAEVKRDTRSL